MDQDGLTANWTYGDIAGALTAISYPGHTSENVTFTHDSYGRTTNTTDAESSYSCTFGDRDEMVTGTRTYTGLPARTLTFAYYPNGSRKSMQLPVAPTGYTNSNCYTYEYDAGGRLTELDDNLGHTNTFSFDDNNRITGQVSGNGLTMAITRNPLGQGTDLLNTLVSGATTSAVSEFNDFAYDGVGNLTSVTASVAASSSLSGTTTFGYDTKDQLTSESNTATGAAVSNSFAYDGAGNATTFRGTSRSFNSANEFSGTGFAYDDRGNPTTYAGSICTFDVFNRATSLGSALTAGYRTDGMRAWKQDSSGTRTYFLYDGTSPLVEMDSDGNYNSEFVYGPAGLISHSRASLGTVFFAYDERGNVQSVWRDTGTLVSSRAYDAYGNQSGGIVASSTYDDPEIGYGGQHAYITDPETGLAICGHRYYDPSAGRWLNRDPIGYAGGSNTYRYCENNPVMGVDPSGLANISIGYNKDTGIIDMAGGGDWGRLCYEAKAAYEFMGMMPGHGALGGIVEAPSGGGGEGGSGGTSSGGEGDKTLYRGMDPAQSSDWDMNGLDSIYGGEGAHFTQIRGLGESYGQNKGGGTSFITMNDPTYQALVNAGFIRPAPTGGSLTSQCVLTQEGAQILKGAVGVTIGKL